MMIEEIYKKILELQDAKTEIETKIKKYKKELDEKISAERDLEVKIVYVPDWVNDVEEYLLGKFPTYDFVSINKETRMATIREKDAYLPKKIEFEDGGRAYRRISKGRPSIDLYELQKGYPDIFSKIVKLVPEIDEDKFNQLLEEDPSFINVVEEVIRMDSPSVSIVVSRSRKELE